MPVIKSAKKKLRQDKSRTARNSAVEEVFKLALKKAKKSKTAETVRLATKATDKAVKYHIIHKNKAARIKSSLSKLVAGKSSPKIEVKAKTKTEKKATLKKSLAKKTPKSSKK